MDVLPLGLTTALESGRCVLFVGAGVGRHALNADGDPTPTAAELTIELAKAFGITLEPATAADLAKVAQIVEIRKGRSELDAFLKERLAELEPDSTLRWLFGLTWKAVFTTNWDRVIERAYELLPDPRQTPVSISSTSELQSHDPRFEVPVYHLHGSLFSLERPYALVTQQDYARFAEQRRMLFEIFKHEYATSTILYVGYSLSDPNWQMVTAELRAEFQPNEPPTSYRVAPSTSDLDRELLAAQGVETIDADLATFEAAVTATLGDIRVEPSRLDQIAAQIPPGLSDAFEESPAPVARLLNSWDFINDVDLGHAPNVRDFLSGDHPNWPLVAQGIPFERDVFDSIFDELLDFATEAKPTARVVAVLAPAGYGVSTVLMSLAAQTVRERAGRVFFHRRGAKLSEGDVEYATSLTPHSEAPAFFFIDNASDFHSSIATAVTRLRELGAPACFVLGERLNEWRQMPTRIWAREHLIEPLSDGEIGRLLAFLSDHDALGVLADLEPTLRVSAIKQRHQKELLVAMKEATEGKGFVTIIEDEYRGIADEFSQKVYSTVCGFYRLRVMPRDQLLAQILDVPVLDIYERTRDTTAGVIRWETVDEARGIHVARARHHVIAEIVWERATASADRSELVVKAMNALNLNYYSDAKAYESLVRSDDVVDSIGTFDGRVRFFEMAIRKDPRSPYVRQHYARMLRREGRHELALDAVDKAIEMGPDVRVLYHTRGLILTDLALRHESGEVARRRLRQAEEAFKHTINLQPRDSYGYHGLASLYLDWAKRREPDAPDESAEFLQLAESAISDGLRSARDLESLWILSASVREWLGDSPRAMKALEEAVASTNAGTIGRYLLARSYRRSGEPQKAIDAIRPVIRDSPDEFRACVVHALALWDLGAPYRECIAVLRLGDLYGPRDPRYTAVLGGMLFMDRQFSEAEHVFLEARKRSFSYAELNKVEWVPRDKEGGPLRLEGEVVTVKSGYAFISVPGYSDFFCPGSKFGEVIMRRGERLVFTPGFAAKGPMVLKPQPIPKDHSTLQRT